MVVGESTEVNVAFTPVDAIDKTFTVNSNGDKATYEVTGTKIKFTGAKTGNAVIDIASNDTPTATASLSITVKEKEISE